MVKTTKWGILMEISSLPLFSGIGQREYEEMLACGGVRTATFEKGARLFRAGEPTKEFGVLLEGEVHVESIDLWGNRIILHSIPAGHAFAETYALCGVPLMVDVTAVRHSRVLLVRLPALLAGQNSRKPWYPKLLHSLARLLARKNLAWSDRVFCLSTKGVRGRVMTYLSAQAVKQGSTDLTIPFDRQQLADYLNVERTALSKELGRMQREGILTFRKNRFCLHKLQPEAR